MSTRSTTRAVAAIVAVGLAAALLLVGGPGPSAQAATGAITPFGASTSGLFPTGGIVEGPDGHVYFANPWGSGPTNGIGEVTPSGTITFHTDPAIDGPADLTIGGDGNIWFTDPTAGPPGQQTGRIGRLNLTTGAVTLFSPGSVLFPFKIATAPDGSIWFNGGGSVAQRMHTGGTGTAGSLGVTTNTSGTTGDIALGPDGNMWITKSNGPTHELLRVNPTTGNTQAFAIPQGNVGPRQLTIGPDGNLWFTHTGFAQPGVMRYVIDTNTFTNFPIPAGSNPKGITAGDDGNLWFIRGNTGTIGRISPTGTGYTTFTATGLSFGPSPQEIAPGPGNTLWAGGGGSPRRIARIAVDPPSCDGLAITVDLNRGESPTNGDDVILGTPGPDTIDGLGGNDRICGGDRGDTVNGGPGNDRIFGFKGSDVLSGGADNDRVVGGKGNDTCRGNAGTDTQQTCETRTGFP